MYKLHLYSQTEIKLYVHMLVMVLHIMLCTEQNTQVVKISVYFREC